MLVFHFCNFDPGIHFLKNIVQVSLEPPRNVNKVCVILDGSGPSQSKESLTVTLTILDPDKSMFHEVSSPPFEASDLQPTHLLGLDSVALSQRGSCAVSRGRHCTPYSSSNGPQFPSIAVKSLRNIACCRSPVRNSLRSLQFKF